MSSKTLTLDTTAIVQMLADPVFYEQNLAFLFMQDTGLAAARQYLDAVKNHGPAEKDCCDGRSDDRRYVRGPINTFVRTVARLTELPAAPDSGINQLRAYIERRLGHALDSVQLHYKLDDGRERKLTF